MFETKAVSFPHVMESYKDHLKKMSVAVSELGKVYEYTYTFGKKQQEGAMSPVTVEALLTTDNRWVLSVKMLREKVFMAFDRLHHIMGDDVRVSYEDFFVVGRVVTTDEETLSKLFGRVAAEEW